MADNVQKITNRVRRQLKGSEAQVEAFVARLEKLIDSEFSEVVNKIAAGKLYAVDVAKQLGSILSKLEQAGLGERIKEVKKIFADELRFVRDEFTEQDIEAPLKDADSVLINTLIDNSIGQISNKVTEYGLDLQSVVTQRVLTGTEVNYKKIRKELGDKVASQIKTEVNTAVLTFNQTVTINRATELGFDLFVYIGPDDKVTREFCKDLLSKDPPIYTLSEIKSMDNGQGLPVLTARGGYNCRHQWRPISLKDAEARGYKA